MNSIAVISGDLVLYWNGIVLALGLAAGLCLSLALYPRYNRHSAAVWVFFPFAVLLGLILSRLIYWYCHIEQFGSFWECLASPNTGSYAMPGVILGVLAAAQVSKKLKLVQRSGRLLDAVAPGLSLSLAFVRLSELFNSSGRSRITIQKPLFQRLPFAVPVTDSSGAVSWSLAAFFLSFLALLVITVVLVRLYLRYRRYPMADGSNPNGNVFCLFLLLWGATEVIIDSVRNDSCLMHFTLLKQLNPYASFVSLGQVFAGVTILIVMIRFTAVCVRGKGWSFKLVLGWLLFLASLFGAGFLGEYRVQRTANYALCYTIMAASLILLTAVILLVYRSCIDKTPPEDEFTV